MNNALFSRDIRFSNLKKVRLFFYTEFFEAGFRLQARFTCLSSVSCFSCNSLYHNLKEEIMLKSGSKPSLTARQRAIYEFLKDKILNRGYDSEKNSKSGHKSSTIFH